MSNVTIKINTRFKKNQHLLEFFKELAKTDKSVQIIEEESPYNQEFVEEIHKSRKSRGKKINTDDLWK